MVFSSSLAALQYEPIILVSEISFLIIASTYYIPENYNAMLCMAEEHQHFQWRPKNFSFHISPASFSWMKERKKNEERQIYSFNVSVWPIHNPTHHHHHCRHRLSTENPFFSWYGDKTLNIFHNVFFNIISFSFFHDAICSEENERNSPFLILLRILLFVKCSFTWNIRVALRSGDRKKKRKTWPQRNLCPILMYA